jgi:hypothetical protein
MLGEHTASPYEDNNETLLLVPTHFTVTQSHNTEDHNTKIISVLAVTGT